MIKSSLLNTIVVSAFMGLLIGTAVPVWVLAGVQIYHAASKSVGYATADATNILRPR